MAAVAKKEASNAAAVHLIHGDDSYLVTGEAHALVNKLCPPEQQAFGLDVVDGAVTLVEEAIEALHKTLEALKTLPFMGGRKVVWLRDASFFQETVVGRSRDVKDVAAHLVEMIKQGLPPDVFLVITAPNVDGRSAFSKACQSHGTVMEFAVPDQNEKNEKVIRQRADEMCSKLGLTMEDDVISRLIEKTGYDTRQILNELDKLSIYLGSRRQAELEDVEAIVSTSRETLTWDFADAVAEKRLPAALKILRQLLFQGENVMGLMIGLERRFRELLTLRECMDRKWLTLSGQSPWFKAAWSGGAEVDAMLSSMEKDPRKANPFRTGRLTAQAAKNSGPRLIRCLELTLEGHEKMVSSRMESDLVLENLVIRLLS